MIDGVKGGAEVEKDENVEVTGVGGEEKVVGDFEECSFRTVVGAESGLECFIQVIGREVMFELSGYSAFQNF